MISKTMQGLMIASLALGFAGAATAADGDLDGVDDAVDNCAAAANAGQADADGDGAGDACDADYDNNGVVDEADFDIIAAAFGSVAGEEAFVAAADHDGDGVIAGVDLGIHRGLAAN